MWGVSDPAERPRGRGCEARAGSLTPISTPTPVLGRSAGGTERRPTRTMAVAAKVLACMQLAGASSRGVHHMEAEATLTRRQARGANRAPGQRPPPRPLAATNPRPQAAIGHSVFASAARLSESGHSIPKLGSNGHTKAMPENSIPRPASSCQRYRIESVARGRKTVQRPKPT